MTALTIMSALFAFVAAILWLWSALVRMPAEFHIQSIQTNFARQAVRGAFAQPVGYGHSEELIELGHALKRQSRLSAAAAICAAISALLQGASLVTNFACHC